MNHETLFARTPAPRLVRGLGRALRAGAAVIGCALLSAPAVSAEDTGGNPPADTEQSRSAATPAPDTAIDEDGPIVAPSADADTRRALLAAWRDLGEGHVPRTEHLLADGSPKYVNRLVREASPYLLQHAHNPVDWHPWGEEAFARAAAEDKPVFLSIGYATCHWCHVMERESFEDEAIAELMNRHFVSIKVDREQLPDIDALYMTAVQLLTGGGGWPMSSFLDTEARPFYGGTYFPPERFTDLLERVAYAWATEHDALLAEAGYEDGFRVTLDCPNDRYINDEAICQAVVGMFARAGVTVNLDAKPKAQHFPLIENQTTDFYMLGWGVPTFDSEYVFNFLVHTPTDDRGSWNASGYSNAEVDEMIVSLSSETDLDKRAETVASIWEQVQADTLYLPIHNQVLNWGMDDGIEFDVQPEDQPHFKFLSYAN